MEPTTGQPAPVESAEPEQDAAEPSAAEFYGRIGRRGGSRTRERYGREHYAEIGRKGGRATAARHGPEFYEAIGRKGGERVRELIARAKELSPHSG